MSAVGAAVKQMQAVQELFRCQNLRKPMQLPKASCLLLVMKTVVIPT